MDALIAYVDGVGLWTPRSPDWAALLRLLENGEATSDANTRPPASVLPPAERRRAPEPVLIACEAAAQACTMAAREPASLACVFTSTHGDLAITDAMCATLADDPRGLSPTRFHNSVHNAPAGYWTVATHCHKAATAISAAHGSFAAGLLEAAIEVISEGDAIVLSAYDIAAQGALADVAPSALPFATALVLSPTRGAHTLARLTLSMTPANATEPDVPTLLAPLLRNPMAVQALPLLLALAHRRTREVHIGAGDETMLRVEVTP
jgi:Beta-ketoacyl synthase, N-terminal domain